MNRIPKFVKQFCFKALLFISSALLLCTVQPAGAALVSATAMIDWSTFKITPIDTGQGLPTLTWISQTDYCQAYTDQQYEITDASSWNTDIRTGAGISTPILTVSSYADTSASQLMAQSSLNGSIGIESRHFNAIIKREGTFSVQGNGRLLFQADYKFDGVLITDVTDSNTYPYVRSGVSFSLSSPDSSGGSSESHSRYLTSTDDYGKSGVISAAMDFEDGWEGALSAEVFAYSAYPDPNSPAPIPLPIGAWLFGSALAGMAGLRRSGFGQPRAA